MATVASNKRIAFFLPALHGGGAERVVVNLLKGMSAQGISLDLVLASAEGSYINEVPRQVRIVDLAAGRVIKAILPLLRYLRREKPMALLSHMNHANVIAVVAKKLASTETKLVLVEHDTLSATKARLFRGKLILPLVKVLYPHADDIIGVSEGSAKDLEANFNIPKQKLSVIYNPVVSDELFLKAKTPSIVHPWLQAGNPPVFLAVGRLTQQKDFFTLIKAFALLRNQTVARLIILGEGEDRNKLEAAIARQGLGEDISLPGFTENPYSYMSRASAFVLSSRWEALPTVLIEAMACGCPVVATDCLSGPAEVLQAGLYGSLVKVGDPTALAKAMLQVLEAPIERSLLVRRAMDFSFETIIPQYLQLIGYT